MQMRINLAHFPDLHALLGELWAVEARRQAIYQVLWNYVNYCRIISACNKGKRAIFPAVLRIAGYSPTLVAAALA
jgi:hypothetical protein